jgi:hypothetical protein
MAESDFFIEQLTEESPVLEIVFVLVIVSLIFVLPLLPGRLKASDLTGRDLELLYG